MNYIKEMVDMFEAIKKNNLPGIDKVFLENAAKPHFESYFMTYIREDEPTAFKNAMRPASNDKDTNTDLGCAVLKHLNFDNQLYVLDEFLTPKIEYFTSLTQAPNFDLNKVLDSRIYQYEIATCFQYDDFETLEEMSQLFGIDVLTHKHNSGYCYQEVNITGNKFNKMFIQRRQEFDTAFYAPYYNIILNHTPEKEAYLISKGIPLPSVEIAEEFATAIMNTCKSNTQKTASERAEAYQTIHNYIKLKNYNEMQEALPHHNKTTRSAKI